MTNIMKKILLFFSLLLGVTTILVAQPVPTNNFSWACDELKEKEALTPKMVKKKQAAFQCRRLFFLVGIIIDLLPFVKCVY